MKGSKARAILATAVVVSGVAGAATVAGAGPLAADDTFVGCVQHASGQLKVVDASQACAAGDRRIEWRSAGALLNADTLDGLDSTDFLAADGTAADADLLDGLDASDLSLHCASGFTRSEDVCYSERHAAAAWTQALIDCANRFARLPTAAEQTRIFRDRTGLGLNEEYWTQDALSSSTALAVRLNTFIFSEREAPRSEQIGYFCVQSPENAAAAAASAMRAAAADDAGVDIRPE